GHLDSQLSDIVNLEVGSRNISRKNDLVNTYKVSTVYRYGITCCGIFIGNRCNRHRRRIRESSRPKGAINTKRIIEWISWWNFSRYLCKGFVDSVGKSCVISRYRKGYFF